MGREARVNTVPIFNPDVPGLVRLQYEVSERAPARVGQIHVVGNERTKQNVVLRQVPVYPGQVLSYPDLRVAERNLARLQLFETSPDGAVRPTVTVIDPDTPGSTKTFGTGQRNDHGQPLFGVGVNSDLGLTGSLVLTERNFDITRLPTSLDDLISGSAFRGAGQEFKAEAVPGTQLQRYSMSWREPHLFDSQISLGTQAYYYSRAFNEYTEGRTGGRVSLGRKINDYWYGNLSARAENVGVYNVAPWEPEDYTSVVGNNFLLGLRANVTRDSRDSPMRPTEGSVIDFPLSNSLVPTRHPCSARNTTNIGQPFNGRTVPVAMSWPLGASFLGLGITHPSMRSILPVVFEVCAVSNSEEWGQVRTGI